jgi:hypothetical protein
MQGDVDERVSKDIANHTFQHRDPKDCKLAVSQGVDECNASKSPQEKV